MKLKLRSSNQQRHTMIIAVDGPAGSGKGTISEYLALKYDLLYLDTGLLYRALAKAVIRERVDPKNSQAVANIARTLTLADVQDPDLRGEDTAAIASQVAVVPEARQILDEFQRAFCRSVKTPYKGAILDGRDIGTVICPDATCKLFITARPEIRNQRRMLETSVSAGSSPESLAAIAQKIAERDTRDSTRKIAPLTPATDAIIIDTSDLTIEQACTKAAQYVEKCCFEKGA
jgi:cytidylate kinase